MKKILIALLSLSMLVACTSANAKDAKEMATYLESVDDYNTFQVIKLVDKETRCKYVVVNYSGRSTPSVIQMLNQDGKPLCN
jgi:outer membrane lipoprotein-sorting protein